MGNIKSFSLEGSSGDEYFDKRQVFIFIPSSPGLVTLILHGAVMTTAWCRPGQLWSVVAMELLYVSNVAFLSSRLFIVLSGTTQGGADAGWAGRRYEVGVGAALRKSFGGEMIRLGRVPRTFSTWIRWKGRESLVHRVLSR